MSFATATAVHNGGGIIFEKHFMLSFRSASEKLHGTGLEALVAFLMTIGAVFMFPWQISTSIVLSIYARLIHLCTTDSWTSPIARHWYLGSGSYTEQTRWLDNFVKYWVSSSLLDDRGKGAVLFALPPPCLPQPSRSLEQPHIYPRGLRKEASPRVTLSAAKAGSVAAYAAGTGEYLLHKLNKLCYACVGVQTTRRACPSTIMWAPYVHHRRHGPPVP